MSAPNAQPMSEEKRLEAATNQLDLVMGFFPRADTKLSVVLGIDLGMLAVVTSRLPRMDDLTISMYGAGGAFLLALAFSFYHLWNGAFPHLAGGTNSLVYFRSIAGMSESNYRLGYTELSPGDLAEDMLGQVWRNSKILDSKFSSLCYAYRATLLAVPFWLLLLYLLPAISMLRG